MGKKRKASLEILPKGEHIVDDIVVTFLFLETKRQK